MKMLHLDKVAVVTIATILFCSISYSAGLLAVMSVDLGSEFLKIALVKPGVPMEIVTNDDSARKTASMVVLRDGERLFGNAAQTMATRFPNKAFWYLTNIVGKKFEDPDVQRYIKRFPYYNLVKDEERGTVLFQIDEETQYSPEELLAMQLEKAKQYAETFADQPVKDAVITVPAYFTQAERRAVLMAAELGGLNVLQIMGDNAAVALNYGVFRRKQFNTSMQYIMFYDMGATSTTASVVGYQEVKMKEGTRAVDNPQLVVKGVGFDKDLGGLEMSLRLRDHLAKHFHEKKKTKFDVYSNNRAMAKLLKESERLKKVLSANTEHMAQIEGLLDDEDFKLKVTRAELEHLSEDMFDRVTKPIEDALKASEITTGEISDVILMGGGTRVPKVQEILMKYLGRTELGKSINTDEAAAMGAVYQAAHLGKGFKVLTFGVKEANVYPLVVEFEKHRSEDSTDPPKVIKRTLFGRMNPFPQKKVMTFNKHFKDFDFNVTYGDLDFMSEEEAGTFRKLQGQVHSVALKGVEDAYSKHTDKEDAKGIKAHFRMDENGVLSLETVEAVFEKENVEEKEESAWSKLGDTIGNLFGSSDKADDTKVETGTDTSEDNKTSSDASSSGDKKKEEGSTDKSESGKKKEKKASTVEEEKSEEDKKDEQTTADQTDEKKDEETKEEQKDEAEKKEEKTDDKKDKSDKKEDGKKNGKKKDKEDKKAEEEAEKKPKIVIVKENITSDVLITDISPPTKEKLKASKKKLSDLTAKDKEKQLLEKAKNELESFIYDMGDKLTQELYEKCSTEEERESINKNLGDASDWLYDQDDDTKKEAFTNKLKDLKKEVKDLEFRVTQLKERPEALEALRQMLNHSTFFLKSVQNLSLLEEDPIFTKVEVETLEKLINETQEWKTNTEAEQKKLANSVKPVLLLEDIGYKIQALDREVKYLINKAKTYKPKPKPKPSKNKTEDKNETVTESDSSSANETKDSSEEPIKTEESQSESTSKDDIETEIPAPPKDGAQSSGDQSSQTEEEPLHLGDGEKDTETTTAQPDETNTHDAGDL